jgi:ribosome-binding protein aMBF1 (putative translation factor)
LGYAQTAKNLNAGDMPQMDNAKTPKSTFSQLIKTARVAAGMSQLELATRVGHTSGQYISNLERGRVCFPKKLILKLSATLNISVSDLVMARANDIIQEMESAKSLVDSTESV